MKKLLKKLLGFIVLWFCIGVYIMAIVRCCITSLAIVDSHNIFSQLGLILCVNSIIIGLMVYFISYALKTFKKLK
jgi:hypothetical protein